MNADEMIAHIRDEAVQAAIRDAESRSSGEVRVFITQRTVGDPVREAWKIFGRLKMQHTAARNAVLIFIAPSSRQFALVGDEGLVPHCDAAYWAALARELADGFRRGDYTGALTGVIHRLGETLALHFPPQARDTNELPDDIVRG